jgi:hypothetical protein
VAALILCLTSWKTKNAGSHCGVFANVPNNAFGPEITSMLRDLPPEHFGFPNVSVIGPYSCMLTPAGYITWPHVNEPLLCVNIFHYIVGQKLWIVAPPTLKNLSMWETDPTQKKQILWLAHFLHLGGAGLNHLS